MSQMIERNADAVNEQRRTEQDSRHPMSAA
jgi:hypothetical protein